METKDKVIFRVIRGEINAFIPGKNPMLNGNITCYAHIGQHSDAGIDYYRLGRLATEEEYTPLKQELESIGYNIKVYKKLSLNK